MTEPTKPRTRILAILDSKGKIHDLHTVRAEDFGTVPDFYAELVRVRKLLLKKYKARQYQLLEGAADNLGDLFWSYPELREAVS